VTIAANADNDPLLNGWNILVLESLYLLFRGVKPSSLAMDQAKVRFFEYKSLVHQYLVQVCLNCVFLDFDFRLFRIRRLSHWGVFLSQASVAALLKDIRSERAKITEKIISASYL